MRHFSSSVTLGTGFLGDSVDFFESFVGYFFLGTEVGVFEADFYDLFQIVSFGDSGSTSATEPFESSSENISNQVSDIKIYGSSIESTEIEASAASTKSAKSSFSVHIVLLSFFLVGKDSVGFVDLLEFFFISSSVGVVFDCEFSEGFFDLGSGS